VPLMPRIALGEVTSRLPALVFSELASWIYCASAVTVTVSDVLPISILSLPTSRV